MASEHSFYVTTPIYYVNAAPASRPRVHDDRRRHPGAPPSPARRGRLLPDGHRRARRAGRCAAERRASTPQELADRNAERFKALCRGSTRPTTSSSARRTPSTGAVQEVLQRVHDNGHVYKGTYEGWYCPRCADFKAENEIEEGNTLPDPPHRAHARAGGELVLRACRRSRSALEELYAERPDFVTPRHRYNEALSFIRGGLQDVSLSARQPDVGREGAVGPEPRLLRVVRRAAQLLHGALLRARRRGPDGALLAGDLPPHRQGHPASSTPSTGRRC